MSDESGFVGSRSALMICLARPKASRRRPRKKVKQGGAWLNGFGLMLIKQLE
jgi:hypothetical protein